LCDYRLSINGDDILTEMRRILTYIAFAVIAAAALCGCGVTKILRSGQYDLVYEKAMEFYDKKKWNKAGQLLEGIQHHYVGTPKEDSVAYYTAYCKFKAKDYQDASILLDQFRHRYGRSRFLEDVEGMYALCYYNMSPAPTRDQSLTRAAIVAISEYLSHYPASEHADEFNAMMHELNERLHDKAYINAYTYYKIGRYKSAAVAMRNALKQYPDSKHREDIMYYIVMSSYRLAHNSIESKKADRYLSMLDSYYSFIAEYPESKHVKELTRLTKEAKNYLDKTNHNEDI